MTYCSGEDVFNHLAPPNNWVKSVAVSTVTRFFAWHTLARATNILISALILQDKNHKALQVAIDAEIQEVEKSVMSLHDSLFSLSEVVL